MDSREYLPLSKRLKQEIIKALLYVIHLLVWSIKFVKLSGIYLFIPKGVFSPKFTITTSLVMKVLDREIKEDDVVLDMGTGSGIIAIMAARKARLVYAIDVNEKALATAMLNAKMNNISGNKIRFIRGSLFEPLKGKRFSLIIFNPPYLYGVPSTPYEMAIETTPSLLIKFLAQAKRYLTNNGRIVLAYSTLSSSKLLWRMIIKCSWSCKFLAYKKLPWETIFIIRLRPRS